MIDFLLDLDQDIFLFFNGFHAPFWDRAMFMFSGRFIWVPMYAAFLFAAYRSFNWKVATVWILAIAVAITFSDQICASFFRPYFERLRPSNLDNPLSQLAHVVNDYRGGVYGFPSCHAANSFALAMSLALIWRGSRLKWFIFIWAAINSYSRVYLGVHYPGDLFVGAVIGSLIGVAVYFFFRAIVWKMVNGDMWKARAVRKTLVINGREITYRSIDAAILIGLATMVTIALIAVD